MQFFNVSQRGRRLRLGHLVVAIGASLSFVIAGLPANAQGARRGPVLSESALYSYFGKIKGVTPELKELRSGLLLDGMSQSKASVQQVNADYNLRPQDEPSIGILKGTAGSSARWVVGANDYAIGVPVGGGLYNSEHATYFAPFPLLAATDGTNLLFTEPPAGTGDPAIASGTTRATASIPAGRTVTYAASLVFSASFCENGVMVARSFDNGASWNRTRVPTFGASGFVTYWDNAFDCSVFNDKEYIAVDNTGGPHDGRIYITWSRFLNDPTGLYQESAIALAYSDDNASTFSTPVAISGTSSKFCLNHSNALSPATACNENQNSTPVVLANGDLAVSFENGNGAGFAAVRGQMLVTVYNADTNTVVGPYQAAPLVYDGAFDLPLTNDGSRQTFCNSNFRSGVDGSLAVDGSGALYLSYWDDKKHAGEFVTTTGGNIAVGDRSSGYACPAGKATDTDIYVLRSADGGVTWQDATPNSGHAANDQFWPWVAANGSRVSVVFYDRSGDIYNKLIDTRLAGKSGRGGWGSNLISTFSSNFDNAFFGGGNFAGDYINAAMDSAGQTHAAWTCVAPGKQDSDICMNKTDD